MKKKTTHSYLIIVKKENGKEIVKERFRVEWKANNRVEELKRIYESKNYIIEIGGKKDE